MDMFYQEPELLAAGAAGERRGRRGSLTYGELVRDLLADERHFLRDLHLIIRVFKDELEKILERDSRVSISFVFGFPCYSSPIKALLLLAPSTFMRIITSHIHLPL